MPTFVPPSPESGGKLPDCRGLKMLRARGWSYQELMDEYGVSNQAVTAKLRNCGLVDARIDYSSVLPWKIRPEHRSQNINIQLHAAARQKMGVGKPLTPRAQRQLDAWLKNLEENDVVVHYGRGRIGGEIGYGFYYVPRRHGVDDWIIRMPKGWTPGEQIAAEG